MENKKLKSFKDLLVWQKSADLAVFVYSFTDKFPKSEIYGIANQMRRAAISISSNLAEGFKRRHKKEKIQFYNIAHSSATELESQIEISRRLKFLSEEDCNKSLNNVIEVSKMINGLINSSILNPQFSILNSGFTIVELIVAMGLFMILMGIATGGFVKSLRTQRAVVGLMDANDNASFVLEQMAREIRTGYNFSKISDTELQFVNSKNIVVWYRLNQESVERASRDETSGTMTTADYKKITADNVKISNFKIILLGNSNYPPRITVSLSVSSTNKYLEGMSTNIQTTISARKIN